MSEELLVRHCAPTLAGIKTGSMFTCAFANTDDMISSIRKLNGIFIKKGVRALPLRHGKDRTLVYVFRPNKLVKDLQNTTAQKLLSDRGYSLKTPERCITHLIRRLGESKDFPHEIGLFLGYPPEDVHGFIENKAGGCKCVGTWKVYGDEEKAKKTFEKYKKCAEVYRDRWKKGTPIERLTVTV